MNITISYCNDYMLYMTNMTENAHKYIDSRKVFRVQSVNKFYESNPQMRPLVFNVNECVAASVLFLSGKDLSFIEHGMYIGGLVVSFCRSHFIAVDLIEASDLIEGCLLIRKQLELMSRLQEIRKGVSEETWTRKKPKTPNVGYLDSSLARLYTEYSTISHSGNPKVMQLLGRSNQKEENRIILYPEFQENSYVAMQHLSINALEFWCWFCDFKTQYFSETDDFDWSYFHNTVALLKSIYGEKKT